MLVITDSETFIKQYIRGAMSECELCIQFIYGRAAIYMNKNTNLRIVLAILVVVLAWSVFSPLPVVAKVRSHLSVKNKKLSVGQEYTLKMKGISAKDKKKGRKVRWKVSNKSVILIKGKKDFSITLRARKTGNVKVTGIYRGKKYTCKIKVKDDGAGEQKPKEQTDTNENQPNIHMNASELNIYFLSATDKKYLSESENHTYSYQFKVEGIKKSTDVKWSIESDEKVSCFKVDNGRVYMWRSPGYEENHEDAFVVASLSDGTRITAKLHGYSERNEAVKNIVNGFVNDKLTSDMTEYEKLDAIASYVSLNFEYQLYQSDWITMALGGSGDCFSSRCFVRYLCQAAGIKAVICVGDSLDGMTLAKADGKLYVVMTGFRDTQPRKYRIYEPTEESLQSIVSRSHIDLAYFD